MGGVPHLSFLVFLLLLLPFRHAVQLAHLSSVAAPTSEVPPHQFLQILPSGLGNADKQGGPPAVAPSPFSSSSSSFHTSDWHHRRNVQSSAHQPHGEEHQREEGEEEAEDQLKGAVVEELQGRDRRRGIVDWGTDGSGRGSGRS